MWWLYKKSVIFSFFLLLGCGFSPLYGKHGTTSHTLSNVEVIPVPGRHGQLLTMALQDYIDPEATGSTAYHLRTQISVKSVPIIINEDGTVSRYRVDFVAPFTLENIENGQVIHKGKASRSSSYNVSDADYTTYVSLEYTIEQGIRELSRDIAHKTGAALFNHETQ